MKNVLITLLLFLMPSVGHAFENKAEDLVFAMGEWPKSFNPLVKSGIITYSVSSQLFAGLTVLTDKGIEPYLAEKWEVSEDCKTYRFYLHDQAKFHNGHLITSSDVEFSVRLSAEYHPFAPFLENIKEIKIINEKCLDIHLYVADENFPALFLPNLVPIFPKSVYLNSDIRSLDYDFVGSGPYKLKSLEENSMIELEKFSEFFLSDKVNFNTLVFKIYPDYYEMFYALTMRKIDGFFSADFLTLPEEKHILQNYRVMPFEYVYPYKAIIFNMKNPLLSEKKVRQALTLALDKERLAAYFDKPFVVPMNGPLPPTHAFACCLAHCCDVAAANGLLEDLGLKKNGSGKRFSIKIDYLPYSYMNEIVSWLQYQWAGALGVDLIVQDKNMETLQDRNKLSDDFDLFLDEFFIWQLPHIGMHRFYYSDFGNKKNLSHYENKKIDELFVQFSRSENMEKKKKILCRIQNLLAEDYASLWLLTNRVFLVCTKEIAGLENIPYKIMSPLINVAYHE